MLEELLNVGAVSQCWAFSYQSYSMSLAPFWIISSEKFVLFQVVSERHFHFKKQPLRPGWLSLKPALADLRPRTSWSRIICRPHSRWACSSVRSSAARMLKLKEVSATHDWNWRCWQLRESAGVWGGVNNVHHHELLDALIGSIGSECPVLLHTCCWTSQLFFYSSDQSNWEQDWAELRWLL